MADMSLEEREALADLPRSKLFKGLVFVFHGPIPGYTSSKLTKLIKNHGGKVMDDIKGNAEVSHVILSGQVWGKQNTPGADPLVKLMLRANEENATESDDEYNRTWILEVTWVFACLARGKIVDESEHDWDLRSRDDKASKQAKRKAQLDKERERNNGESVFGRGERVKWEKEQKLKREEAEAAKLAKTDAPAADFSGLNSITQKGDEKEKGKAKQSPPQVSDSSEESDSGDKTKGKAKGKGKAKQSSLKDFKYGRQEKPKTSSKPSKTFRTIDELSDDSEDPKPAARAGKFSRRRPVESDSSEETEKPAKKRQADRSKASSSRAPAVTKKASARRGETIEISDTSDDSLPIEPIKRKNKAPSPTRKKASPKPVQKKRKSTHRASSSPSPQPSSDADSDDSRRFKSKKKSLPSLVETKGKGKKRMTKDKGDSEDDSPTEHEDSDEVELREPQASRKDRSTKFQSGLGSVTRREDRKDKEEVAEPKKLSKIKVITQTVTTKVKAKPKATESTSTTKQQSKAASSSSRKPSTSTSSSSKKASTSTLPSSKPKSKPSLKRALKKHETSTVEETEEEDSTAKEEAKPRKKRMVISDSEEEI